MYLEPADRALPAAHYPGDPDQYADDALDPQKIRSQAVAAASAAGKQFASVSTALIWVPAAIYLFVTGETGWGIFMVIWGVMVIGSVDNFLRPLFMQGARMGTVVVFFSLLA